MKKIFRGDVGIVPLHMVDSDIIAKNIFNGLRTFPIILYLPLEKPNE